MDTGRTAATPCVPLVFALSAQLDRILEEGLEIRWHRHVEMREITLDWAQRLGFSPFVADRARRSPTVSCLNADGRYLTQLAQRALERCRFPPSR